MKRSRNKPEKPFASSQPISMLSSYRLTREEIGRMVDLMISQVAGQ